jgi:hypothetical protein
LWFCQNLTDFKRNAFYLECFCNSLNTAINARLYLQQPFPLMEVGLQQIESLLYYLRFVTTLEVAKITRESIKAYFLERALLRGFSKPCLPRSLDMSPPFLPIAPHNTISFKSDNRYGSLEAKNQPKLKQAADILSGLRLEFHYRMDVRKATNVTNTCKCSHFLFHFVLSFIFLH